MDCKCSVAATTKASGQLHQPQSCGPLCLFHRDYYGLFINTFFTNACYLYHTRKIIIFLMNGVVSDSRPTRSSSFVPTKRCEVSEVSPLCAMFMHEHALARSEVRIMNLREQCRIADFRTQRYQSSSQFAQ